MTDKSEALRIITPACAVRMLSTGLGSGYGITASVLNLLHGVSEALCPECDQRLSIKQTERYYLLQRITCPNCKKQPMATKNTVLHNAEITPEELFLIANNIACGESIIAISKKIDKSADTVRAWRKKMEEITPVYA